MAKGLMQTLASMEDFDEVVETPVVDVVEAADVETELLAAQEEGQVVEEMTDDLETAEEAVDAMEALIESLESIQENGGMDKNAARMYNIARQSIYARMGEAIAQESFSLESFDSVSSRQTATSISLEAEKSKVREWAEAIWKFIKETWKKFVAWIKSFFDVLKKTKERATKLKESVSKGNASNFAGELTEKQAETYGRKILHKKSEKESLKKITADFTFYVENLAAAGIPKAVVEYAKADLKAVEESGKQEATKEAFEKSLEDNLDKFIKSVTGHFDGGNRGLLAKKVLNWSKNTAMGKDNGYVMGPSLGNTYAAIYTAGTEFTMGVKALENGELTLGNGQLPTTKADVIDILNNVIKALDIQIKFNSEVEKMSAELDKLTDGFKAKSEIAQENLVSGAIKGYRNLFTKSTSFSTAYSSFVGSGAKSILDLVYIAISKEGNAQAPAKEEKKEEDKK